VKPFPPIWGDWIVCERRMPELRRQLADAQRYATAAAHPHDRTYYADVAKRLGEALAQYEQEPA
jgi:hypothetical protein